MHALDADLLKKDLEAKLQRLVEEDVGEMWKKRVKIRTESRTAGNGRPFQRSLFNHLSRRTSDKRQCIEFEAL